MNQMRLFSVCCFFFMLAFVVSADEIANKDLQTLTIKEKETEVMLKMAEKDARDLLFKIGKNQVEVKNYEKEIGQKELQIEKTQQALEKVQEILLKAEEDLKLRKTALSSRLVSMYKVKMRKLVDSILASDDLNVMLKRYRYFSEIIKEDKTSIQGLIKSRNYYKQTLNEIFNKKKELESLIEVNNQLKGKLIEKETSLQKLFENATRKKDKLNEQILAMKEEEKALKEQIQSDLAKNEQARQKELEEKRKAEKAKADLEKGSAEKLNSAVKTGKNEKARLIWPVGNIDKVVSKYGISGIRSLDIQHYNNGIDIMVPGVEDVKCSFDGIVIYKGFMNGYGNIVIIDHGNSLVTVYANLSSQEVGMNEYVKQGITIGKTVKNEKFHFEIRENSESKDPLNWLL